MRIVTRMRTLRTAAASVTLACALLSGCQSASRPPVASPAPAAAAPLPLELRWVQRSAEYHALVVQAYRLATAHVERQAASRKPGSWAVILDADETIISNLQYQIERAGAGYTPETWTAWVRRREAVPLAGAAAFLARVHQLGGRIAIVTNRLESECADTIAVFKTHTLAFDAMLCRPDKGPSDKNPRFAAVAAGSSGTGNGPLEVVAYVGDNILDFPSLSQAVREQGEAALSDFGARYFILPNPMYGSWQ